MVKPKFVLGVAGVLTALLAAPAGAGDADVVGVTVTETGTRIYRFDVTVRHEDSGWEHYANRWDVLAPDGRVLATRVLVHPHEQEQPFTRSLSGVTVPAEILFVTVRAHGNVHGYGGAEQTVSMTK